MKLSIIILSYKSEKFLEDCLHKIYFDGSYEIMVVDNDHNSPLLKKAKEFKNVKILPYKENLGFAEGNNRGIRQAKGEYILTLNADAFLTKNYIKELVDFLDQHQDYASVQGKLLSYKNKKIIDATANYLTWSGFAFSENHRIKDKKPESAEVFGVCAAAALYRRSALEEVSTGGEYFDKDFFAYLEDVDLDWRLRLYGFKAYYLGKAICYHYREATTNHKFRRKQALRNVILMNYKNDSLANLIWKLPFYFILNLIFLFPSNLKDFFSLLPKMKVKRKIIINHKKIKNINKWLRPFPRRHLTKIFYASRLDKFLVVFLAVLFYAAFALAVFWNPIVHGFGAIQWDAVSVHFFNLFFSSQTWHNGYLPLWTPYIFGGFPHIADLQVAIFYPVNLLIALLTVITPEIMLYQLVFHYILACLFAFLFAYSLSKNAFFSLGAGLAYGFGGFMVGHASHVGMQNTATWLPLLMLLMHLTLQKRRLIYAVWGGAFLGVAILAGHFQMVLYIAYALGLYAVCHIVWALVHKHFRAAIAKIGLVLILYVVALLISAVQILPTQELTGHSQRSAVSLESSQTESLNPLSLHGLLFSNHYNAAHGEYNGPWDRTQNYLYLSITILGLAGAGVLLGVFSREERGLTLFFILLAEVSLLYVFGKYGPLQPYFYHYVPFFDKIRAPGNMILVFNLCVVALAAIGFRRFGKMFPENKIGWTMIIGGIATLLIVVELFPAVQKNNLLYARVSPQKVIQSSDLTRAIIADYAGLEAMQKFAVFRIPGLNSNSSQYYHIYNFDGYNPLELQRHSRYVTAMATYAPLVDLAGIKYLPCELIAERAAVLRHVGGFCVNDRYLPQIFFAADSILVPNAEEALKKLTEIDVRKTLLLESANPDSLRISSVPTKDAVAIVDSHPGYWKIRTTNVHDGVLFLRQANYPGWKATIDGNETSIHQADYLFQALAVPGGEHMVVLEFFPATLVRGARLTIMGWLFVIGISGFEVVRRIRRRRSNTKLQKSIFLI